MRPTSSLIKITTRSALVSVTLMASLSAYCHPIWTPSAGPSATAFHHAPHHLTVAPRPIFIDPTRRSISTVSTVSTYLAPPPAAYLAPSPTVLAYPPTVFTYPTPVYITPENAYWNSRYYNPAISVNPNRLGYYDRREIEFRHPHKPFHRHF